MSAIIRLADQNDAAGMLEIYAPLVWDTPISFELEPPSVDEFKQRVSSYLEFAPWLVCESEGQIMGYAYASRFRPRAAYQWNAEVTVYVRESAHRKGVGRALYTSLFECLGLQGFFGAVAVIALPNPASVALHENFGFKPVGVFRSIGYKLGKWHDVGWWQLELGEYGNSPSPPMLPEEIIDTLEWHKAIENGRALLKF